jgi:L-iditol 2-dehydrogenase
VILAVPSESAARFALKSVRKGGRIVFFAEFPEDVPIPLSPNYLYQNEVALLGSYSSSYKLLSQSADIVFERRIDVRPLITDTFRLERLAEAIETALHPTDRTLKVVIQPWSQKK